MTDSPSSQTAVPVRRSAPVVKIAAAFLLPLFFVIAFPLLFVGAIHKPTPHELSILVVGPDQVVSQIAAGLDGTDEYAATATDVVDDAKSSVEERKVMGSILVSVDTADAAGNAAPAGSAAPADPAAATATASPGSAGAPTYTVTTYVANAEGRAVAATVTAAGEKIAEQLGTTATVEDLAPLAATDTLGVTLFYLLTYTSVGGYLVVIVLMQVMPKARLSTRFGAVTVAAIAAPLVAFGLSSIFVGDYGASFGTIMGLLGVIALYVFTVGSVGILIEQFLGKAATFGIMLFVVFLNFPSAGGAAPAAMLPPFWQFMHEVYFGAGAYEAMRSIVYFGGNGAARWIFQLLAWTFGIVLINVVVYLAKTVRRQKREIAELSRAATGGPELQGQSEADSTGDPASAKHVKVEVYQLYEPDRTEDPHHEPVRALTQSEGETR